MMPENKWNNYQILKGLSLPYVTRLKQRFWAKVDVGGPDECWEWVGANQPAGYGTIGVTSPHVNRGQLAHRVAYELFVGPIPEGQWVLHKCDNRLCVNPKHLFLGTSQDNVDDMMAKGRHVPSPGVRNGSAKLTPGSAAWAYKMLNEHGFKVRRIASMVGITHQSLMAVRDDEVWTHVTNRLLM